MEDDINKRMEELPREIDNFVQNCLRTKNLNLQDYQKLSERVYDVFKEAGFTRSVHPDAGIKWRDEQIKKLDDLVKWIGQYELKIRSVGYGKNVGDLQNSPKSDILGQASFGIRREYCLDFPV